MATFQLPSVFGKKTSVTVEYLVARTRELEREIRATKDHVASLEAELLKLDVLAGEAGLSGQLAKALAPPPVAPTVSYTRVKAIKAYKILWRGPHGGEWYSGGPNAVNDIPSELLRELKGRVEAVPASTQVHGVPLADWMRLDD